GTSAGAVRGRSRTEGDPLVRRRPLAERADDFRDERVAGRAARGATGSITAGVELEPRRAIDVAASRESHHGLDAPLLDSSPRLRPFVADRHQHVAAKLTH